jgi:hypothetical protein
MPKVFFSERPQPLARDVPMHVKFHWAVLARNSGNPLRNIHPVAWLPQEAIALATRLMRTNQEECFDIAGARAAIQAELRDT